MNLKKIYLIYSQVMDQKISEYFMALRNEADTLRKDAVFIIEHEKDEDKVTEGMILRDEYCMKVQKLYDTLADYIDDMESLQRRAREMKREMRTDNSKLEKLKWYLVRERKYAR